MNVRGRWLEGPSTWRRIALNTWSGPNDPTVYGLLDIEVRALEAFLKHRSAEAAVKCTITHAVTRAVAMTLARHPECNVLVRGSRVWVRDDVDVFVQVAMPSALEGERRADLSGAVIRGAAAKRVEAIAAELRDRAQRVRERSDGAMARTRGLLDMLPDAAVRAGMAALGFLQYDMNLRLPATPRDPFGGAMVTSVGSLGITHALAPIVTFSRCPIVVAVGAVEERPVVHEGEVVARPVCTLGITFDHRVFDGFQGGRMAAELRAVLVEPERLDEVAS